MNKITFSELKETRAGFAEGLLEAGKKNPEIYALCADLTPSVKMDLFAQAFPERFIQVGIAEANMIGIAAGLANSGKTCFAASFAGFISGRVYDQIRMVAAYSEKNIKICASHAGITCGEDGATHQMMEDLGLMKMLPNMTVINPCDFNQTKAATLAVAAHQGPCYLRYGRPAVPNFTPENQTFEIGKGILMKEGKDLTFIATGHLVSPCLEAAYELQETGIDVEVINIHTIKPLDIEIILKSVAKTRCVVTAEEHYKNGGLGESVAGVLALNLPAPMEMVAMEDVFGESGKPTELLEKFGLDKKHIIEKARKVITRK